MARFFKHFFAVLLLAALAIAAFYIYFRSSGIYAAETTSKSPTEFDFSAYSFGIIAVAVTFAGVYISIVPDRCSDQIMKIVELHYIPHLFNDIGRLETTCKPEQDNGSTRRTDGVKVLYAVSQLIRWASLDDADRDKHTGSEGLGTGRSWLGKGFLLFQYQTDRLVIATVGIVISIIYVLAPIAYWIDSEKIAVGMLYTVYICSIVEMLLCAFFYAIRYGYISHFEQRVVSFEGEISNFLTMVTKAKVPNAGSIA